MQAFCWCSPRTCVSAADSAWSAHPHEVLSTSGRTSTTEQATGCTCCSTCSVGGLSEQPGWRLSLEGFAVHKEVEAASAGGRGVMSFGAITLAAVTGTCHKPAVVSIVDVDGYIEQCFGSARTSWHGTATWHEDVATRAYEKTRHGLYCQVATAAKREQ